MNLGDGVLSAALRAEAVTARLEVRLEDRFEHQLQGSLRHPVGNGGDAQAAQLAVRLRNPPLPHSGGGEPAGLEVISQPSQELPDVTYGAGGYPVHACRACSLVAPDPLPSY